MKIVLREVVKRFGSVTAVDRASLDVGDGELFTLLGPSGCGKTRLLRLVAGFYRPDAGEIVFGERVVNALPPYERNIGMVFQNYALWPHMTVFANVAYGLRLQVRAEIRKLQKELGITALYVTHDQEEALSLSDRVAVMRDGKVLQVGAPKELYERPLTRFVADFVGTNNLLQGTVKERRGEELLVETALGVFRAMPNSGIGPGDACVLAIRPENVAIGSGPAAASDGNVIRGRVTFASYLGNTLRYDVEVERGQVVKADIRDPWHHEPFALGQAVAVSFPPSVTLAIADDTG